jgi:beta-apo-4'-carotenal oxygenase
MHLLTRLPQLSKLQGSSNLKPLFDRNGNRIRGLGYWVGLVFKLGGDDTKGALSRWMVVVAAAVGMKRYADRNGLPNYLR